MNLRHKLFYAYHAQINNILRVLFNINIIIIIWWVHDHRNFCCWVYFEDFENFSSQLNLARRKSFKRNMSGLSMTVSTKKGKTDVFAVETGYISSLCLIYTWHFLACSKIDWYVFCSFTYLVVHDIRSRWCVWYSRLRR